MKRILMMPCISVTVPQIVTTALPGATQGQAYSASIVAAGGQIPYTFSYTGTLNAGLTFNSASGLVSGTPTGPENDTLLVTVTDANQLQGVSTVTLAIAISGSPTITPSSYLPNGTQGVTYSSATLYASGGAAPYTWAVLSGNLDPGLTLSSAGVLSGVPTTVALDSVVVQVTDANGRTASQSFSFNVTVATTGYDGIAQVGSGAYANQFVNSSGQPVQFRGSNMGALTIVGVQHQPVSTWGGTKANWITYKTWKPNYTRIGIHGDSWMGLTTYDGAGGGFDVLTATSTSLVMETNWTFATMQAQVAFPDNETVVATMTNGSPNVTWTSGPITSVPAVGAHLDIFFWGPSRTNDPQGNYRATYIMAVAEAQNAGTAVEIDLHWIGPTYTLLGYTRVLTCNNAQPTFADTHALPFWIDICSVFGSNVAGQTVTLESNGKSFTINNKAILFGAINEPQLDNYGGVLSAGSPDVALLVGGTNTRYANGSGGPYNIVATWTMAGHQAVLNTIRGTGARNVLLCGGNAFAQNMKNFVKWMPTDSITPSQVASYVHPYPNQGNSKYPNPYPMTNYGPWPLVGSDSGYAAPSSSDFQYIKAVLAKYPVIANEVGDANCGPTNSNAALVTQYGAPGLKEIHVQADLLGFSVATFCWDLAIISSAGTLVPPPVNDVYINNNISYPTLGQGTEQYNWQVNHTP